MNMPLSSEPLVSIIIPAYNSESYIAKAIDSGLGQTYPNVEVIVVDDGSTDDTWKLLVGYGDRIRAFRQENRGAAAARNRGLQEVRGEYIAFLDADDRYLPDNIAEKVHFLQSHDEFAWCYSNWAWVDASGVPYRYGDEPEVSLARQKAQGDVLLKALQGYRLGTNVFLFSRRVIEHVAGFDQSLAVLEDYDLYVRSAAGFPVGYVDKVLCEIFEHPGSLGTGCSQKTGHYSRWKLNRKLQKMFPERIREIWPCWRVIQSDLYRNLAEISLASGRPKRAMVLLRASLAHKRWQPGIMLLWWRIKRSAS